MRTGPRLGRSEGGAQVAGEFGGSSRQLRQASGIAPDAEAAQWIVLALLSRPLPDSTAERRMVERFVAPAPINR